MSDAGKLHIAEGDKPSSPAAGSRVIYPGSDGRLLGLDSNGVLKRLDHTGIGVYKHLHAALAANASKFTATGWAILNKIGGQSCLSGYTINDDHIYYIPAPAMRDLVIQEVAINVSSAATGGTQSNTIRIGLYYNARDALNQDTPAKYPEDLIAEIGAFDVTSTGEKKFTGLSLTLEEGRLYWWGLGLDVNVSCQVYQVGAQDSLNLYGVQSTWVAGTTGIDEFGDTSSGLPADASATLPGSNILNGGPAVGVRFA